MADPQDMILPLLREMRSEMQGGFDRMDRKFAEHDERFDNLRQAVNGESVLGRYAAPEVEGRLQAIEQRLERLLSFEERLSALEIAS